MKSLKLILAATIFSLALSIPSYAGDIGSPANPIQPPPATCTTCDQTSEETATTENFAVDIFLALLSFF